MQPVAKRLQQQMDFIAEIDKVKHIIRQNYLTDATRKENDAEHSWHFALMASILVEYSAQPIDVLRVIKMILIHDLVEIDAGDTYAYDEEAIKSQRDREVRAADRIFHILPSDQAAEYRQLWDEFEARITPEAKYAAALDRLHPLFLNYLSGGHSWKEHGIKKEQAIARNQHMKDGAPELWNFALQLIQEATERGMLQK